MKYTVALKRLQRALRGLKDGQGVIARRNARAAVAREMRHLRASVDAEYPVLRNPGVKRRKRANLKTLEGQNLAERRFKKAGLVAIDGAQAVLFGTRGIRVHKLPELVHATKEWRGRGHDRHVVSIDRGRPERYYIPGWAVTIGPDAKRLALAKRSQVNRDAILVEKGLDN